MANQTVKVKGPEGDVELTVLSEDEIDSLLNDNNPASRKQIMEHMKLLGRPVTELIKLKVPERKAFILERYVELGVKGAKAKGKGGTVTQLKAGPATGKAAAAAVATKAKVTKAAPPPDDDDDDDDDETPQTDSGTGNSGAVGAVVSALKDQIEQQAEALNELKDLLGGYEERFDRILTGLNDQMKLLLDAHFIVRSALPTAAGLSEDDVVEIGNEAGNYGRLLVGEVDGEAAAGNG